MRVTLLLFFTWMALGAPGCGARQKSYTSMTEAESGAVEAPMDADMPLEMAMVRSSEGAPAPAPVSRYDKMKREPLVKSDESAESPPNRGPARKVVYTGYLKVRVRHLLEAQERLVEITNEHEGYVESMTSTHVVVRIPASDFEAVLDALSRVGETLSRSVRAADVTERYTDMTARLAVAKEARERLLALLESTKDTKERLRILREIKRLTEQIETMGAQLETLKNLIDFYTITIELVPVRDPSEDAPHLSSFNWVANLSPYAPPLMEDGDDEPFELQLPQGFYLLEDVGRWEARSADTSVLSGSVIDNEPLGDEAFWVKAIGHEMDGRGEKLLEHKTSGPMTYLLYLNDDVENRYYMIAIHVIEDEIFLLEAFFPNEESYGRHFAPVVKSLESFRAK